MPTANWTRVVIALAAATGIGFALATTGKADIGAARAVWTASGFVILLLFVYDRWIWRIGPLNRLTSRPNLQGTWKAALQTTWPERADETIECYVAVRQTYSRITVDMLFERSVSRWISGDLVLEDGRCVLYYVFRTEARALHRDGNAPARGGAALVVAREPALHLEGDYWTERDTRGGIRSTGRSRKIFETFESARAATYS